MSNYLSLITMKVREYGATGDKSCHLLPGEKQQELITFYKEFFDFQKVESLARSHPVNALSP